MGLRQQLDDDVKAAMLSGDSLKVETLRGLKTVVLYADVATKSRDTGGIEDDAILALFAKELKKRQESADLYVQGGSQERADKELAEKAIIETYLPAQLSDDELGKLVDAAIADTGAKDVKDMGKVIGTVKAKAGNAAEGSAIARLVAERLSRNMILLMGVAGAGKSIQGHQLADQYGYAYISTGEIFRVLITGKRRNEMLQGKLLSDDEVIMVVDKVLELINTKEQFILDGFPRTKPQVDWLLAEHKAGRFDLPKAINLEIPEHVIRERLTARGRLDDNEEAIAYRYEQYQAVTRPLLAYMQETGIEIFDIDADRDPGAVHRDILRAMGHLFITNPESKK